MQTRFGKGHPFPLLPAPLYPSVSPAPPSAPTSQWSVSAGKASSIAAALIPPEESSQRRQLQRLGDVLIHADRLGGLHILGKGVGGHGDNRHTLAVIARAAADGAGRVVAVPRAIDRQPAHFQQFCGNLGIELIVLYQQHASPGLPAARFPVARTDIAPRKNQKLAQHPLTVGQRYGILFPVAG